MTSGGNSPWPRVIDIPNSQNLRDMGGYTTADGRAVKWRHLYRSANMSLLGEAQQPELEALGIRVICDLRSSKERELRPCVWHLGLGIDYACHEYSMSIGDMEALAQKITGQPEAIDEFIDEIYRALPYELAEPFRDAFHRLASGQAPLLFACGAGKDRTGILAALILHALGVPRVTIEQDFALTDLTMERLITKFQQDGRFAGLMNLPREQYLPLFRSDPAVLKITFDEIESRHGSVEGYLLEVLGVEEKEIRAMRGLLLEKG